MTKPGDLYKSHMKKKATKVSPVSKKARKAGKKRKSMPLSVKSDPLTFQRVPFGQYKDVTPKSTSKLWPSLRGLKRGAVIGAPKRKKLIKGQGMKCKKHKQMRCKHC